MGTHAIIRLCVRTSDSTEVVTYVCIYCHYDGDFESLGVWLASFLDGIVITNGFSNTTDIREFNGSGDLFARIITLLKESPENPGNYYIYDPSDKEEEEEYNYRIIVVDEKYINFEANDSEEISFIGSPSEFLKEFGSNSSSGSKLYSRSLPVKKMEKKELFESRKQILQELKDQILDLENIPQELIKFKRSKIVSLLDGLVYP